MKIRFSDILESSAKALLANQTASGHLPAGHNGPYHDEDTPVRNTAHALYLFSELYRRTGDESYRAGAEKALAYLQGTEARPHGANFHHRNKAGKDKVNGVVGAAWCIEALVHAADVLNDTSAYELAEAVFLIHPFDERLKVWKRIEIDGKVLPYDSTFNHQLWMAAAASQLKSTALAQERSLGFLRHVAGKVEQYDDGVIFHKSSMGSVLAHRHLGLRPVLGTMKNRWQAHKNKSKLYVKSVGYHSFNLYAFALLKRAFPDEPLWLSMWFKRLLHACRQEQFQKVLQESPYGYFYNASGLELAFFFELFGGSKQEIEAWLSAQWQATWDGPDSPLTRNVEDPNTALAKVYCGARITREYEFNV